MTSPHYDVVFKDPDNEDIELTQHEAGCFNATDVIQIQYGQEDHNGFTPSVFLTRNQLRQLIAYCQEKGIV